MTDQSLTVIEDEEITALTRLPINLLDQPSESFAAALQRRLDNRKSMMTAIKSYLKADVDYGTIPLKKGLAKTKPTLFKSGGEKIASLLGLVARFPVYQDYEKAALTGVTIELIIIHCELVDSFGRVVAEGIGARHIAQDGRDANKALKMASKSASLSAILNLGFSEIFTVDLDDLVSPSQSEPARSEPMVNTITPEQCSQLTGLIVHLGLDPTRVETYCKKVVSAKGLGPINHIAALPEELFEMILKKLPELAEQNKAA